MATSQPGQNPDDELARLIAGLSPEQRAHFAAKVGGTLRQARLIGEHEAALAALRANPSAETSAAYRATSNALRGHVAAVRSDRPDAHQVVADSVTFDPPMEG